ncbi:tat protein [Human immunodeficiency virus 2]|uniref:Protein Tat n=2 Tax=Human immunodeficiency virus type 2 subtype B (isolate UC1) TaxID=388822 RepID=TAT_HV2UC|nr:RecName: Full=Protein Tat; AltName: Full=Transactivating regulatory protein [HIV-2 B_UC1]AAA43940.1 tat protein [Human immunodeficiency virus 2]
MEIPLQEQESSLKSSSEPSSSTSEPVVNTQGSDNQGEEILSQLYRPLEACDNKCYCKKCCYHCQLCFLKKGLGIWYDHSRKRSSKRAKVTASSASDESLSANTGDSQPTKKQKTKVETKGLTDLGPGR